MFTRIVRAQTSFLRRGIYYASLPNHGDDYHGLSKKLELKETALGEFNHPELKQFLEAFEFKIADEEKLKFAHGTVPKAAMNRLQRIAKQMNHAQEN